jgi:hypothetical protein
MSESGKTVLIVAGVGVGAFVLFRLLAPPTPVATKTTGTPLTSNGTALLGLIPALGGLFGGSSSSSSSSSGTVISQGTFFPTVNTVDTPDQQAYAISHGVTQDQGNQIIDLNTGNALEYGPY